jgi:hypothetical protein
MLQFTACDGLCRPFGKDFRDTGLTAAPAPNSPYPFRWRRVLLKVSGEALSGDGSQNIDPKVQCL